METEPKNGVDYLIDWYALLGVPRDADTETIRAAYKSQQLKYHPDLYARLAPEFAVQAEKRSRLLNEAEGVLSDPAKRAAYDAQLAEWEARKGPISGDGTPIIEIGKRGFLPLALLDEVGTAAEMSAAADDAARRYVGFDGRTFALVERLYLLSGDPASEEGEAYREQLRRRDLFLSVREALLRDRIGLGQISNQAPRAYLASVDEELKDARAGAEMRIAEALLCLPGDEVKRLGAGDDDANGSGDPAEPFDRIRLRALGHFDEMAKAVRDAAAEREKNIEKRFSCLRAEYRPPQPTLFPNLIASTQFDGKTFLRHALAIEGLVVSIDRSVTEEELSRIDEPGEAERWIARGYNVLVIALEDDINFRQQFDQVVLAHFERWADMVQKKEQPS